MPGAAMTRWDWFYAALLAALAAAILVRVAHAQPPEPGSEDYTTLHPHAEWLQQQVDPSTQTRCCSLADCRVVEWRVHGAAVEAYLPGAKFVEAPDRWVAVPDAVIHREENPTGRAIACWSATRPVNAGFYCFWLPDLT